MRHNVALLGCGGYGSYLADIIAKNPNTKLYYCIDPIESKARDIAIKYNSPYDSNVKNVTKLTDIDTVVIATPPESTAETAKFAIERGYNVFCEKPMALTSAKAHEIVQSVEKHNGKLQMDFPYRHMDAIEHIKNMINLGGIKKPIHYFFTTINEPHQENDSTHYNTIKSLAENGCPMVIGGSHYLDLLVYFHNPERLSVSGVGNRMKKDIKGNTLESAVLEFEDGSTASITLGWLPRMSRLKYKDDKKELGIPWPAPIPSDIRLYAENATVVFDYYNTRTLEIQKDENKMPERMQFLESNLKMEEKYVRCISKGWNKFIESLDAGKKPLPNEFDGLKNIILSEAIKKSIDERKVIEVDLSKI